MPGVQDAKVNFGASKIAVYGEASLEEVEKAGAFEGYKIYHENEQVADEKVPFWKNKAMIRIALASVLVLVGWLLSLNTEEENVVPLLFYGSAMVIGGYGLFFKGLRNLVRFRFDMNTLMTVAIIGAAVIGEWSEGAIVVLLFAISEALEAYSMDKARNSIRDLMDIAPKEALIRRGNEEMTVSVDDIQIDDIMIVKPGQKLAMDGLVVKGTSTINQAAITGESIPVSKSKDDEVFAGTLNDEGLLEVRVTKRVEDTTIAKIIHLVEEAQAERAPSQAFVDRFAKYYTPAVIIAAFLIAIIPPLLFNGGWSEWIYTGLAVLVVGCPCALVISTPVSIVTAIGNSARNGVLIKGGVYLEEAGELSAIAFDKTGTLTKGVPEVTDLIYLEEDKNRDLLGIAAAIEKGSQHPLAAAIVQKAEDEQLDINSWSIDEFHSLTGKGVQAKLNEATYYVGSPKLFNELLSSGLNSEVSSKVETIQKQGKTVMGLGTKEKILLLIAVADPIRESSREIIEKLHQLGIRETIMLTGDNENTAQAIGKQLGISKVNADLLPEDKLNAIKELKEQHKVAMIGDGVNDAPALATANLGIAMGGAGTDTALETADIALMADDLDKLPFTVKLSRKALQIIKQNISFSLIVKAVALLLIIPGWLTLWIAILADMGATLLVTLNGLRLLKTKE